MKSIADKKEIIFIQENEAIVPKLYPHQQAIVDRAPMKRLLAFDTGTGKTIASISLCNKHNVKSLLIIVPKTNIKQWETELLKYINKGTVCHIISKETFK